MGKKIRAAQASLVAAFLAAGGAATAKAMGTHSAKPANTIGGKQINWGDQLIRFMKLDGFPSFLKVDGFEALTQFYKESLLSDASVLYDKSSDAVDGALSLYQKADAGPLDGILIGLEQFYKDDNIKPLLDYVKTPDGMANYDKYFKFWDALQAVGRSDDGPSAFDYYVKLTGIQGNPLEQIGAGGGETSG